LRPFEYLEPQSMDEAVALLSAASGAAMPLAGGTDLLDEIKEGIAAPETVVSLAAIPGLGGIVEVDQGLTIGAMTTIADVAAHPVVRAEYTALAQAAEGLATPQIRNVGTLGGNLNQRPRCWYYRHALTVCLKKGGDRCYALAGNSKYLCVTGGDRCYIVHPSDTAVALSALDARIEIVGPGGVRNVPTGAFFISPGEDITRENVLAPGELVTRVHLAAPASSTNDLPSPSGRGVGGEGVTRSLYLKAREREAGDFALVSVAAVLTLEGGVIRRAAVSLGGVAPFPYRAARVEEYLQGQPAEEVDASRAGGLALPEARPMAHNAYKIPLAANLVLRAITQLLGTF
jgi:xanthine dehydrogenase YagS FAD-binding subunit